MTTKHEIDFKTAFLWVETAEAHKYSAEEIYKLILPTLKNLSIEENEGDKFFALVNSYMLLYGLAFENILKALVISSIKDYSIPMSEIQKSDKWSKNHRLTKMLTASNINISENEMFYIKKLEQHLIWQSKYPTPLKELDNSEWSFYHKSDIIFESIFSRIYNLVNEAQKKNEYNFYNWLKKA